MTCCLKFLHLKGNATADEIDDTNGMNFKMQARLNEEFIVTVPISNEKAKVNTLSFDLLWEENMGLTNYLWDPSPYVANYKHFSWSKQKYSKDGINIIYQ